MFITTHRLISLKIYDYVKTHFNIELDKNHFMYGNVKPDIAYRLFTKSHTMKDSLGFVIEEINRIINAENITLKQFSVDLGVINHFMTDFFCSAHYYEDEIEGNMMEHIMYEYRIHNRFKKINKKDILNISDYELGKLKRSNLLKTILSVEESYKNNKWNIDNDLVHALKACFLVTSYVIERAISLHRKEKAA
ncbi:zinc dependent phospholipase C family protein [Caldisalinibacter kiritimatiensis]|uniref:Phospholipase C/D domain-containing protein n=1 Tax=Caldisalinibacter kiritimatiensis TaxID=1304284 RepID=R1AVN7_9FIRM|nr:zinc dependent phospholipase C family protein [Caldisalinibacter kiritimatiensis]EOD00732.1 hypothetical protein L21TH_1184 [Caldisalinibacter kiritimatiensis]